MTSSFSSLASSQHSNTCGRFEWRMPFLPAVLQTSLPLLCLSIGSYPLPAVHPPSPDEEIILQIIAKAAPWESFSDSSGQASAVSWLFHDVVGIFNGSEPISPHRTVLLFREDSVSRLLCSPSIQKQEGRSKCIWNKWMSLCFWKWLEWSVISSLLIQTKLIENFISTVPLSYNWF